MASDEWGFIPLWKQTVRYQPESVISTDQITDFSFSCGLHLCPAARLSWAGLGASTFGSASAVVSHASETCVQALWGDPEGCKILGLVGRGKHVGPWAGREEGGTWGSVQLLIRVLLFPKLGTEWNVESEVITGRWSRRTWNFSADTDLYCAFKARSTSEHCSSCAYPQISLCLYSLSCKCIFSNAVDAKTCIMKRGHIGLASVFILGSLHLWSLTSTWAQVDVNPNPGLSELFWNSNPRCLQSM